MDKVQILCQTRQRKNWSGEGEDFSIAFLAVILSEDLVEQHPLGQGPGHGYVKLKGLL